MLLFVLLLNSDIELLVFRYNQLFCEGDFETAVFERITATYGLAVQCYDRSDFMEIIRDRKGKCFEI